jgi:hypothetical protein
MLRGVLFANRRLRIDPTGAGASAVIRHRDIEVVQLLRRNVEDVQLAALLKHDARVGSRAQARKIDVVIRIVSDLAESAAAGVIRPDIPAPAGIVIGEEIDCITGPHG